MSTKHFEIGEDRQSILSLIDKKIDGLKQIEKRAYGEDATYARQCMEALRDEVEQGLDQP